MIINADKWLSTFLLLISFNVNAGPYIEVGIGKNGIFQEQWEGRDSTAFNGGFGYIWSIGENWNLDLGYQHYSQWTRGKGFDQRPEDSLDAANFTVRYEF